MYFMHNFVFDALLLLFIISKKNNRKFIHFFTRQQCTLFSCQKKLKKKTKKSRSDVLNFALKSHKNAEFVSYFRWLELSRNSASSWRISRNLCKAKTERKFGVISGLVNLFNECIISFYVKFITWRGRDTKKVLLRSAWTPTIESTIDWNDATKYSNMETH